MGRLAKQKMAEKRATPQPRKKPVRLLETADLPPMNFGIYVPTENKRDTWENLTTSQIIEIIFSSFPTMVYSHLLYAYADFLTISSLESKDYPRPDIIDWKSLLYTIQQEKFHRQTCTGTLGGTFAFREYEGPPRPCWNALRYAAVSFSRDDLKLEEEDVWDVIEKYVYRKEGIKLRKELEEDPQWRWYFFARDILQDLKWIEVLFEGDELERRRLREAVERCEKAWFGKIEVSLEGNPSFVITERAKEVQKSWKGCWVDS